MNFLIDFVLTFSVIYTGGSVALILATFGYNATKEQPDSVLVRIVAWVEYILGLTAFGFMLYLALSL